MSSLNIWTRISWELNVMVACGGCGPLFPTFTLILYTSLWLEMVDLYFSVIVSSDPPPLYIFYPLVPLSPVLAKTFPHKVLTYVEYRAVSGVFQNIDPPPPLHPASVSSPRTKGGGVQHSPGGEWIGGSIFWKTPDIGLASYSIISLRLPVYLFVVNLPCCCCWYAQESYLHPISGPDHTPTQISSQIILLLLYNISYTSNILFIIHL